MISQQEIKRYCRAFSHCWGDYPKRVIWFVTERCNLRCNHCFVVNKSHKPREPMSIDLAKRFLARSGISRVTFTGGEPMVYEHFRELLDWCIGLGIEACVCSNGYRNQDLLKGLPRIDLQVSLDGPGAVHDRIRGVGAYRDAIDLILDGCSRGQMVTIVVTVHSENFPYMETFLKDVAKLCIPVIINFVRSGERVDFVPNQKNTLSIEQMRECLRIWEKYCAVNAGHLTKALVRIKAEQVINFCQNRKWDYKCSAGINDAVLYPNGEVSACEMLPPVGNILDYDLDWKKLWKDYPQGLKTCYCQWGCAIVESLPYSIKGASKMAKTLLRGG